MARTCVTISARLRPVRLTPQLNELLGCRWKTTDDASCANPNVMIYNVCIRNYARATHRPGVYAARTDLISSMEADFFSFTETHSVCPSRTITLHLSCTITKCCLNFTQIRVKIAGMSENKTRRASPVRVCAQREIQIREVRRACGVDTAKNLLVLQL